MATNVPKIFFAGDFDARQLSRAIDSALDPVNAVFGDRADAPDDCECIFIGDKTEGLIEIVDPKTAR